MNPTYALWFMALAALWCQLLIAFWLRRVEFRRVARGGQIRTSTLRMWRNLFLLATAATVISVVAGLNMPFDMAPLVPGATVVLAVSPALLWIVIFRAQQIQRLLCPQCFSTGSLASSPPPPKEMWECTSSINAYDEDSHETCGFKLWDRHRKMTKHCFPILGIPASGKTTWMAMLYRQLHPGNFPGSDPIDPRTRPDPGATQSNRLPSPLVFNFRDHDRWGKSNLWVNLFDYFGEVTTHMDVDHPHRKRALEGDGFVFSLDPTESFESQSIAVAHFFEKLRLIRGAKMGQSVRVPAAVCVSKLDHKTVVDKLSGTSFYDDLKKIDPTGESLKLSVLKKRSRLMLEFSDILWPGRQFERQIGELLGGRVMFFPMTPFGLDKKETPLEERSALTPFGILSPLLWLLHMNGYQLLHSQ